MCIRDRLDDGSVKVLSVIFPVVTDIQRLLLGWRVDVQLHQDNVVFMELELYLVIAVGIFDVVADDFDPVSYTHLQSGYL